jgi:hypothetical protein
VGVTKRAEPGGVLVFDRDAVGAQLVDGGRQVLRVPQRDRVDDKTQSRQLVFLSFAVGLTDLPAVADRSCGPAGARATRLRLRVTENGWAILVR